MKWRQSDAEDRWEDQWLRSKTRDKSQPPIYQSLAIVVISQLPSAQTVFHNSYLFSEEAWESWSTSLSFRGLNIFAISGGIKCTALCGRFSCFEDPTRAVDITCCVSKTTFAKGFKAASRQTKDFSCSRHVNVQHVSACLLLPLNTHPPCLTWTHTHAQTNVVPRGQALVDGVRRLGWSWPLTRRSWSPTCILTRWTMRGPSNHHVSECVFFPLVCATCAVSWIFFSYTSMCVLSGLLLLFLLCVRVAKLRNWFLMLHLKEAAWQPL